jgi:hypothetical protein
MRLTSKHDSARLLARTAKFEGGEARSLIS